jgi:Holliday junction resolvasome RuvABC endonuclease subunit
VKSEAESEIKREKVGKMLVKIFGSKDQTLLEASDSFVETVWAEYDLQGYGRLSKEQVSRLVKETFAGLAPEYSKEVFERCYRKVLGTRGQARKAQVSEVVRAVFAQSI